MCIVNQTKAILEQTNIKCFVKKYESMLLEKKNPALAGVYGHLWIEQTFDREFQA